MENRFDVVILGAGPAGLFLARELTRQRPETSIAIIDMGRSVKGRACPLLSSGSCRHCKVCHIAHGVGGAGMYSDGKLSLFPAGTGLTELLGAQTAKDLSHYVYRDLLSGLKDWPTSVTAPNDCGDAQRTLSAIRTSNLDFKRYEVAHVGSEGIQKACDSIEAELRACGVRFFLNTRVHNVTPSDHGFDVYAQDAAGTMALTGSNFVSATGKASGFVLRRILKSVGVPLQYNDIELGVRVETSREAITELTGMHLDAKLKMRHGDAEMRTFCMCRGGYLARCGYDTFTPSRRTMTISGFSLAGKKSKNSNFGLLVRRRFPAGVDPVAAQLPIVSSINKVSDGTVVQRLGDFLARRPSTRGGMRKNSVASSLREATPVNLHNYMPAEILDPVRLFMNRLSQVMPRLGHPDTLLHAPVWELCWDRIPTNGRLETCVPGFYVAGDALGAARGIIQAAVSGVMVARSIMSRLAQIEEERPAVYLGHLPPAIVLGYPRTWDRPGAARHFEGSGPYVGA